MCPRDARSCSVGPPRSEPGHPWYQQSGSSQKPTTVFGEYTRSSSSLSGSQSTAVDSTRRPIRSLKSSDERLSEGLRTLLIVLALVVREPTSSGPRRSAARRSSTRPTCRARPVSEPVIAASSASSLGSQAVVLICSQVTGDQSLHKDRSRIADRARGSVKPAGSVSDGRRLPPRVRDEGLDARSRGTHRSVHRRESASSATAAAAPADRTCPESPMEASPSPHVRSDPDSALSSVRCRGPASSDPPVPAVARGSVENALGARWRASAP